MIVVRKGAKPTLRLQALSTGSTFVPLNTSDNSAILMKMAAVNVGLSDREFKCLVVNLSTGHAFEMDLSRQVEAINGKFIEE